jgi:hypothetical protein
MKSLLATILLCSFSPARASDSILPCLPKNVARDTLVSGDELKSARGETQKPVTVRDALRRIKARCRQGRLFDKTAREIYFFHLIGCWGNPPEDYQERLALQTREIQRLKAKYTVLEIPCAPIDPRQIQ